MGRMMDLIPWNRGGVRPKFGVIGAFMQRKNPCVIKSQLQQALENRRRKHMQGTREPVSVPKPH